MAHQTGDLHVYFCSATEFNFVSGISLKDGPTKDKVTELYI